MDMGHLGLECGSAHSPDLWGSTLMFVAGKVADEVKAV